MVYVKININFIVGESVVVWYLFINSNFCVGKKLLVRMEKYWNMWELFYFFGIVGYEYVEYFFCGGIN